MMCPICKRHVYITLYILYTYTTIPLVSGESLLKGVGFMLSLEGKVVLKLRTISGNFMSGLAVLFASYYVFNLQYDEGAETTLEFLQRYLPK